MMLKCAWNTEKIKLFKFKIAKIYYWYLTGLERGGAITNLITMPVQNQFLAISPYAHHSEVNIYEI